MHCHNELVFSLLHRRGNDDLFTVGTPPPPSVRFSRAGRSALVKVARALRRGRQQRKPCYLARQMNTALPARGLRILRIVPAGGTIRRGWRCEAT
jgi:hypothetical protein